MKLMKQLNDSCINLKQYYVYLEEILHIWLTCTSLNILLLYLHPVFRPSCPRKSIKQEKQICILLFGTTSRVVAHEIASSKKVHGVP